MSKFQIVLADPPWGFETYSYKGKDRSPEKHYKCMSVEEIQALRVFDIMATDSICFLWTTGPHIDHACNVLNRWGCSFRTVGFVWVKCNAAWDNLTTGTGYYTRANAEYCLIGRRGKGLPRQAKDVHQVVIAPRTVHSEKPVEIQRRIERLYGNVSRIELFARKRRRGWAATGLELDGINIRAALKEGVKW